MARITCLAPKPGAREKASAVCPPRQSNQNQTRGRVHPSKRKINRDRVSHTPYHCSRLVRLHRPPEKKRPSESSWYRKTRHRALSKTKKQNQLCGYHKLLLPSTPRLRQPALGVRRESPPSSPWAKRRRAESRDKSRRSSVVNVSSERPKKHTPAFR